MPAAEGRVRVFNEGLHAALLEPAPVASPTSTLDRDTGFRSSSLSTATKSRRKKSGQNRDEGATQLKEMHEQELARFEADCKRRVEEAVRRTEERRERRFEYLERDIEESKKYLDELDREFSRQAEAKTMKLKKQYNAWDEAVHSRIMNDIRAQIQAMDYKELHGRKNNDMQQFLDTTNRKASIFRDIIIESEYDPLEPNRRSVKARVGTIEDPVKMLLNKHEQEQNMLTRKSNTNWRGTRRKQETPTRETLDVQLWSTEKIKGTPHGIFSNMMSTSSKKHGDRTTPAANGVPQREQRIHFDHYNIATGEGVLMAELPKGKRTYPAKPTRIDIS